MSVRTLADVRSTLANRINGVGGLRAYPYANAAPSPPAASVVPMRGDYEADTDGSVDHELDIWIHVAQADTVRSQQQMDEYLSPVGPKALKPAIEAGGHYAVTGYEVASETVLTEGLHHLRGILRVRYAE